MLAPLSTGMACCEEKVEMLDDGNIATKSASNAVCLFSAGINECFPLSRRAVAMQPMWLQKGQIPFFCGLCRIRCFAGTVNEKRVPCPTRLQTVRALRTVWLSAILQKVGATVCSHLKSK